MNKAQAKVKYFGTKHWKWIDKYESPDKYQWLNTNDVDLHPIRTKNPECPAWHLITNFGQEPEDQVFVRDKLPSKIDALVKTIRNKVRKDKKLDTMSSKYRAFYNEVWDTLETDRNYTECLDWISEQWYYRLNGKWFFINGKPTYLCGWHWFYLNYWHIENFGLPEYRVRDREWFWGMWYFYNDTTIPIKDENDKLQYNDDGSLMLEDVGYRTVVGVNGLKGRRMGDTTKADEIEFCIISAMKEGKGGIQGDTGETAKKAFLEKLMFSYNKLAFFWKPAQAQLNPKSELLFDSDDVEFGLQSIIDHATTASKSHYDGRKLHCYHGDEAGKCLGFEEEILMADGTSRKIIDVNVDDSVMGIDGTPRKVLNKTVGEDDMYRVIPNKWESWTCNSKHIMTVKWADINSPFNGKTKDDIINISIDDYMKASARSKKHMMLFKGESNFKSNKHILNPYLVGLYLGDGSINNGTISNIDKEIIDYLNKYAVENGYELTCSNISYRLSVETSRRVCVYDANTGDKLKEYFGVNTASEEEGINHHTIRAHNTRENPYKGKYYKISKQKETFKSLLKKEGILEEKSIPDSYLRDSRENRLQLLAGLIDTDGYLDKKRDKPGFYEITQVKKDLSYQIYELAQGLGFHVTIRDKKTSMKRSDGSYFRGHAYRISIYGDLYKIPCKIERKIAKKTVFHKNRRNPNHTGFKVEPIGKGKYCGIQIDGDGLFMLSNHLVVHNCTLEDIHERHSVVKRCMVLGSKLIGFAMYTTTVDNMSAKSGVQFKKLSNNSHYEERTDGGFTKTGMVNMFFPAYEGFEGFIGKYGESIVDTPTEEQVAYLSTPRRNSNGQWMGAREFLQAERDALTKAGDFVELAHQKRLYPFTFAECFTPPAQNIFFNMDILEKNHIELTRDNMAAIQGNFEWIDGFGSNVDFFPSSSGRWFVSFLFHDKSQANNKFINDGVMYPGNALKFVSSSDAFRLEKTQGTSSQSDGGGVVRMRRDPLVDPDDKDISQWESCRSVAVYCNRPSIDQYCEDMLKQDIYYGSMQYPENNVNHVAKFYEDHGYAGYLLYDYDIKTGRLKANAGFHSGGALKQKLFNLVGADIEKHGLRNRHIQITDECMEIKGLDDMTNYDLFTAYGGTLLAEESQHAEFLQYMQDGDSFDIDGLY